MTTDPYVGPTEPGAEPDQDSGDRERVRPPRTTTQKALIEAGCVIVWSSRVSRATRSTSPGRDWTPSPTPRWPGSDMKSAVGDGDDVDVVGRVGVDVPDVYLGLTAHRQRHLADFVLGLIR